MCYLGQPLKNLVAVSLLRSDSFPKLNRNKIAIKLFLQMISIHYMEKYLIRFRIKLGIYTL
jgi:hypothetical protein